MIDPKDVIKRTTVEELAETADEYYRVVSDPTPLMIKPFSFLHETPELLQNLGLLLSGLHLGKTMSVLDFGAGTCWISRFLCQLNCRVIACDVSRAALDIGRRLVDELPLLGTAPFRPEFLWFDGHRFEIPDGSVDRILCFDAFHHVPNQAEVLREFGRVLIRGGIAGFSEPGREHSRSPQSQYEMRNHKVLENDIRLDEIFALAQAAGFTHLTVKHLADLEMSLDDYSLISGEGEKESLKAEIWNQTYTTMFNRLIFFLHKGPLRRDSRSHVGLAHEIGIARTDYSVVEGEPLALTFKIKNTGEAHWLNKNFEIFGVVRLASHLYADDGSLIAVDHSRHDLPVPAAPGESLEMAIRLAPLPKPGRYRLAFDLVAEGVTWFENQGSRPVEIRVEVKNR